MVQNKLQRIAQMVSCHSKPYRNFSMKVETLRWMNNKLEMID
jgi:hypothetical protein